MSRCSGSTCNSARPCAACAATDRLPMEPTSPPQGGPARSSWVRQDTSSRSAPRSGRAAPSHAYVDPKRARCSLPLGSGSPAASVRSTAGGGVASHVPVRSVANPAANLTFALPPLPPLPLINGQYRQVGAGRLYPSVPTYGTIKDAIDASDDHDVILVHDGVYTGSRNRDLSFKGLALTVRSVFGPSNCVIDLEGKSGHRAFIFKDGETPETARLVGVTIRNGNDQDGAAVKCIGDTDEIRGSPTIEDCTIIQCRARRKGGAVYATNNSVPAIINCRLWDNEAGSDGGPIALQGPIKPDTMFARQESGPQSQRLPRPVVRGCNIARNRSGGDGGGVWIHDKCDPRFAECEIVANRSSRSGGGVAIDPLCGSTFDSCRIDNNTAAVNGGGVWCKESQPRLMDCIISHNVAVTNGGGVWLMDSVVSLNPSPPPPWNDVGHFTRCRVLSNATGASGAGGGMFVGITRLAGVRGGVTFNHGFIARNRAGRGGGVFVQRAIAYLNNSVVNGNLTKQGAGNGGAAYVEGDFGKLFVLYCTMVGNEAGGFGGAFYVDGSPLDVNVRPRSTALAFTTELSILNSIVWQNFDRQMWWLGQAAYRSGYVHHDYSNIGAESDPSGWKAHGFGNIHVKPGFVILGNEPDGIMYALRNSSPCKDAAEPSSVFRPAPHTPAGTLLPWCKDIAGGCRLAGDRPDMGAFEVQEPPPPKDCGYCTYGVGGKDPRFFD